jgi:hypothetical protein
MKNIEKLQNAHDIMKAVETMADKFGLEERAALTAMVVRRTLCWVLDHEHGDGPGSVEDVLASFTEAIDRAGYTVIGYERPMAVVPGRSKPDRHESN